MSHPQDEAWWLSKFMLFWITPLIKLASKRQLTEADVWECPREHNVESDARVVRDAWDYERKYSKGN